MTSLGELSGLIVVVSFLSCFAIMTTFIPPQFFTYSEITLPNVPEYFEGIDIQAFAEHKVLSFNETDGGLGWEFTFEWLKDIDIGGHDFDLCFTRANYTQNPSGMRVYMVHHWYEWIFFGHHDYMEWKNNQRRSYGTELTGSNLNSEYLSGNMEFTVSSSSFTVSAVFGFNETLYSLPTDAWNHYDLHIFVGIDFESVSTTINAWTLIANLLFFQMIDVHPYLNMLLAIPLWACIGYLVYVLILKAIPFVGS